MFRLLVIGKSEAVAKEAASWTVAGESLSGHLGKKYDIAGKSLSLKPVPMWVGGAPHTGEALMVVCKEAGDLAAVDAVVAKYAKMPIKFVLYDGVAQQPEYEFKWTAKAITKSAPAELVEKLISEHNELVKRVTLVFNQFDKDHSGFIEDNEIKALYKELGQDISEEEAKNVIRDLDSNKDGKISLAEFSEWWETGGRGAPTRIAGLVEGWMKKSPMLPQIEDLVKKIQAAASSPAAPVEGSFAFHVNRVKAPGVLFELGLMTKGAALTAETQLYSTAVGIAPGEPFIGISFGVKDPAAARQKLEEIINASVTMATSFLPKAEQFLSFVDLKFGEAPNKAVFCIHPSAAGASMVDAVLPQIAPFLSLILPNQVVKMTAAFATDLNKLVTEDRPFYDILLDGISIEAKSQMHPILGTAMSQLTQNNPYMAFCPKETRMILDTVMRVQEWFKSGKGEIEFEVDQALKDTIKNMVGPSPLSAPLKDLKMMVSGSAKEMMGQIPLLEMAYKFFQENVTSIHIIVGKSDLAAYKTSFDLPGLSQFLSV